jgi:hypothetical protein
VRPFFLQRKEGKTCRSFEKVISSKRAAGNEATTAVFHFQLLSHGTKSNRSIAAFNKVK